MPIPQSSTDDHTQGISWADQMEAEEITADNLPAPATTVDGDTKTVVAYEVQDEKIKKIIRVYKVERLRVPKSVAKRKQWQKFGDAQRDRADGPDHSTTAIADEVFLILTTNREDLEQQQQDDDPLKKLKDNQKGMVTCRICKGDHWTTKCPYKDTLGPGTMKELEESASQKSEVTAASVVAAGTSGGGGGSKYVPPNQRGGAAGDGEMKRGESMHSRGSQQDDLNTVRVTNLSEDAQEADLRDLFSHFGNIRRIFLAKDKITQHSKGFAFISYQMRPDAQKAIENLNGYGYDHLILKVEWAKPSANTPGGH